jgi:hypothetical protein
MMVSHKPAIGHTEEREQAMASLQVSSRLGAGARLVRGDLLAGVFVCLAAVSAFAQGGNTSGDTTRTVVAALLLSDSQTKNEVAVENRKDLAVAAPGGKIKETKSWLYFNAGALPKDIVIDEVKLQLTPKGGADTGMTITVVPSKEIAPGRHGEPASYSPPGDQKGDRLVSGPLPPAKNELELRSDSVKLTPKNLLVSGADNTRYIGLLLLPERNASNRKYYGLDATDNMARVPRLIITYRRTLAAVLPCTIEPMPRAPMQSGGRPADTSSCSFVPNKGPIKFA